MYQAARERRPLVTRDGRANLLRAFKATGCIVCGRRYPDLDWSELHIDHIDPRDGNGGGNISALKSGTTAALLAELLLCQVLCVEHHHEKHRHDVSVVSHQLSLFNGSGSWHYR